MGAPESNPAARVLTRSATNVSIKTIAIDHNALASRDVSGVTSTGIRRAGAWPYQGVPLRRGLLPPGCALAEMAQILGDVVESDLLDERTHELLGHGTRHRGVSHRLSTDGRNRTDA